MQGLQARQATAQVAFAHGFAARPQASSLAQRAPLKQAQRKPFAPARGAASRAAPARRAASLRVLAAKGGDVVVVGSSGQTAARVIVQLLRNGFKVTAGVDTDPEEAADLVKFGKKIDILTGSEASALKLASFNPLDADSVGGALRRGTRVVLVVGDQAGNRRPDLKVYDAVVDALLENAGKIGQLVLVTPLGGGGTQIFGRGGGASSARLSPLESKVAASGVDYLIVRAASSDRVDDRYGEEANIVAGGPGGVPTNLQVSRAQVAAAVVQAMSLANEDAVIEVAASPDAPAAPLASVIAGALAQGAQEAAEQAAPARAAPKPAAPAFGFGTRKMSSRPVAEEESESEDEAPAPAKKPLLGGFGTRKITKPEPAAAKKEAPAPPAPKNAPAPLAPKVPVPAFFTIGSKKQQAAEEEEEEEEAAPAPKKAFAFATSSSRRPAAAAATAVEEAPAKRIVRGRKPIAPPAEEKEAPRPAPARQPAAAKAEQGEKKKQGGFLSFLGVSNETVYADEQ